MINDKARDSLLSTETEIYHRQLATKIKGFDNPLGNETKGKESLTYVITLLLKAQHKRKGKSIKKDEVIPLFSFLQKIHFLHEKES